MNARSKQWQRKIVLVAIKKLRKLERKILGITDSEPNYSSLSPIGNANDQRHYSDALDWALKNRSVKDIKNIALTGPYGSGKSTILKTYYNNYSGKDLKFLFISLATFKEESSETKETPSPLTSNDGEKQESSEKNQLLRLIETSILQQIFYHENDNKIPDSRFKKIRSFGFGQLFGYSVIYSLFLISWYVYLKPNFLQRIFKDWQMDQQALDWIHYCSIVIITIGIFGIIFSSIRVIRSVTLQKLNFQNAEIGIGVNQNKSILNHHIDEILYFFSVRPYNVVVIEDLDRFKQTEIFTKLREINLLLNNSNKTKRKDIVFIYAVRDEMFTDKERTKFFDFIIPVIPIINGSNSAKILMAKRREFGYLLSDEVIEDLSYFIDDMRLLHNITNEYYLYRELLEGNLTQDKLFAIITFKNIQPQEFAALSANSGEIYKLIYSKKAEIEKRTSVIIEQIAEIRTEIKRLDDLFITNLEDLRLLYIVRLLPQLKNFKDFKFDGEIIKVEDMAKEYNFAHLENNRLSYEYRYGSFNGGGTETKVIEYKFAVLEKLVDGKRTYKERVKEIDDRNSNKKKTLQVRISELENEKELLRNLPIAEVMKKNAIQLEPGEEIKLEDVLIRNGYIAEDYIDYISLFHDGDISRTDYQFMLNLKNAQTMEMDYKLQKTERVVSKINPLTFQTNLVLNYDLFDQLLKDPETNADRLKRVFEVLQDESETSIKFISNYLQRSLFLERFLRILAKAWPNIWRYFESDVDMKDSEKQDLFCWLIKYLDNIEILELSKHYDLTNKIGADPLFPQIISDQTKIQNLLEVLGIKFKDLDMTGTPAETLNYIYEHDHYQLNPEMLGSMLKEFGKFDQHMFETANFAAVNSSGSKQIIAYINKNINYYVESVYLRLDKNTADEEATILMLLNNPELKIELKNKVVARMDAKVSILSKVKANDIIPELFNQNKVIATWENLLHDFMANEKEISEEMIGFLNEGENAKQVSVHKIPNEGEHKTDYNSFCRKLMEVKEFNDEVLSALAQSVSIWFSDLDLSAHSYEQVEILVNNKIVNPNTENFNYLKEEFYPLHINLFESAPKTTMKIYTDLTLDSDDIELLLKSAKISLTDKSKVLAHFGEDLVTSNRESLKQLIWLLYMDPNFNTSATLIDAALLSSNNNSSERIKVLLERKVADQEFLIAFLSSLGGKYVQINDRSKRPTFQNNDLNHNFFNLLKAKGMISSFPEHKGEYKIYHKVK